MYFEVTAPDGAHYTLGPFGLEKDAETCRAAVIKDKTDHEVGEIFTESPDYLNTLPKPYARVISSNGIEEELWTDGTSKIIPPAPAE